MDLLVIDLDKVLLKTNLVLEQTLQLLKRKPASVLRLPLWALKGTRFFKMHLTHHVPISYTNIPYREEIINKAKEHQGRGGTVVLTSTHPPSVVESFSKYIEMNDLILDSSETRLEKRFGNARIEYLERLPRSGAGTLVSLILKTLRIHQWSKNTLLFVPLLAGHHFFDLRRWGLSWLGFLSFSMAASAVYVINDLLDLRADRCHPKKRSRPFACGDLPIQFGLVLIPVLFGGALLVSSLLLSQRFTLYLLGYWAINLAYALKLKEEIMIDVVLLATLYTLRIIAGGEACQVLVSPWLLAFSVFFFYGLALVKRYVELRHHGEGDTVSGRGYRGADHVFVLGLGQASSMLSIIVLVLYLNSEKVSHLYHHPLRLWTVAPVLVYWISRVWLLAFRGEMDDDPVLFALKDKISWCVAITFGTILMVSL